MIHFTEVLERYGERPFLIENGKAIYYSELTQRMDLAESEIPAISKLSDLCCIDVSWSIDSIIQLLTSWRLGLNVFPGKSAPESCLDPFLSQSPLLVLKTGGTSGTPRHVVHSVDRLFDVYSPQKRPPSRLLPLYSADHIAGIDSLLQAFHRGGTLILIDKPNARNIAQSIDRDEVQILPATPTFLQFLLLSGELEKINTSSVKVIPHGAEPMPEPLRRRVKSAFPNAQLQQRFGLTELGAVPVRQDPRDASALLLKPTPGFEWSIRDGELYIKSPSRMLGTLEEGLLPEKDSWYATGDLAMITNNGGLKILGRREFVINVGGMKIIPEQVESLLLAQESVQDAFVFSRPNPLTGESVCAEVVYSGEPDHMALLGELRRSAKEAGLTLAHVPTRIEAVESIEKTASGKRPRARV